jgi:hypothetical protein
MLLVLAAISIAFFVSAPMAAIASSSSIAKDIDKAICWSF